MAIHLLTTRFNNATWNENVEFREKYNYVGCIYNSPRLMPPKVKPDETVYIIEMNNTLNKIEGIGSIKNNPVLNKYYKIHIDNNYNRFSFQSHTRLDRTEIDVAIIEVLEQLCFKGKTHVKRGQGFMSISKKAIEINNTPYITEMVHQVFINRRNNYDC